jgi:hypothetical protein
MSVLTEPHGVTSQKTPFYKVMNLGQLFQDKVESWDFMNKAMNK